MTLVIATYFWQPDPGSKFAAPYTADDVRRLAKQVRKHCTVPHLFCVITDQPELFDIESMRVVRLDRTTHVPGTCYTRLMTFHPQGRELFRADKLLQIDLDTLIVGNIDHLVTREEDLVLWRNPGRVPWETPTKGRPLYNGSLLLHKLGSLPEVWERFNPLSPPAKDDQWYLSDLFGKSCPYFDGERDGVYRIARQDTPGSGVWGSLPANACIVTCPGSEGKADNPIVRAANPWIVQALA